LYRYSEAQLRSLVSSTIRLVSGKLQTLEGDFWRCSKLKESADASMRDARDAAARRGEAAAASAAADAAAESHRLEEAWTELFGSFRRAKHELDTQAALVESEAARVMTTAHQNRVDYGEGDYGGGAGGGSPSFNDHEPRFASDPPAPHFTDRLVVGAEGGSGSPWWGCTR
jgi:hypothetical protein